MPESEARDEIESVIRKHASDLDADDLRGIASDIEGIADRWEEVTL